MQSKKEKKVRDVEHFRQKPETLKSILLQNHRGSLKPKNVGDVEQKKKPEKSV